MKIVLFNPDNAITGNFMPHLWMFLLRARMPAGHEVVLLDGNARPMNDAELVQFAKNERIDLVGIGMAARPSPNWKKILLRAAGFGGGFAIVAILVLGGIYWWLSRPKVWSSTAITAKPTQLDLQSADEGVRFEFRYAFTNHTGQEYQLPSSDMGALMRKLPKDGSFEKLSDATWDGTIKIPPNQSINVSFMMLYKLSEFSMSSADIDSDTKLAAFAGRRLKEIDGLAFFDYAAKYKIEMPRNWDQPKDGEKK